MSLKTYESTQKKKKSLRDLFGDNLTETGKADLERAGKLAAKDLAMVIFSGQHVSEEKGINSGFLKKPGSECIESGIYWGNDIPSHYRTREVGYDLAARWNTMPIPCRTDVNYLNSNGVKTLNSEQMKAAIEKLARSMNELANKESFLVASDHSEGFHSMKGLKHSTLTVSGMNGEEFVSILPAKLKADDRGLLTRTILQRRRQSTHKLK